MFKPENLGIDGNRLWDSITSEHDLTVNELVMLGQACQELDLIHDINEQIDLSQLRTTGSQGQLVADPLVSELRQHRNTLTQLMKYLRFPEQVAAKSESARASVNKRWGNRNAA